MVRFISGLFYTDIEQQQQDVFSFVAKNYKVLGITWEKIAVTLEQYLDMGNLAQAVRKKFCGQPKAEGD